MTHSVVGFGAVGITRVALCCALGEDPGKVRARLAAGESGLRASPELADLPDDRAGVVDGPDLGPWLRRRKDRKLLARPAQLCLAAAGRALDGWSGDRAELGLFVGVGREPSDSGAAEPALLESHLAGSLDEDRLAARGRDLYPPLLPLQTLPNMALAHVSIHLGILGQNAAWAGGEEAGIQALRSAFWSVAEGRAPAALVAAADSLVDLGGARDQLRLGDSRAPGEASVAIVLERVDRALGRGEPIRAVLDVGPPDRGAGTGPGLSSWKALGWCGAAHGLLEVALAVVGNETHEWVSSAGLRIRARQG
ncbi:MAG: beta-ketoacyl synthase N-terminal-like domain-containing protein [Myxococcota bacterium]|jgi:hypothetical protein|nr:beta-ketoacyl synthase N-terminal-like domain-containing protein [Myxococcota bacterium]